jgi:hypothetical protein
MEKKRFYKITGDYSVYQLLCKPDLYYAIHKTEIVKMDKARLDFPNRNLPDSLIVQGLRLGKVGVKIETTDFWDIIDNKPQELKIKELCPVPIRLMPSNGKL